MLDHTKDTHHLKVLTQALGRFGGLFAIYDRNDKLLFANSAAYDAMPVFFGALRDSQDMRAATRLEINAFNPDFPEAEAQRLEDVMIERFYNQSVYEVGISKGRTMQVTHQHLDENHILGLGVDVTEIKSQQAEMETLAEENYRLANTDHLTGLANRRQFIKQLEDMISDCAASGCSFFVGLIDLNGFKRVNDLYGHAIGDELLTGVARLATDFIDETTFIARLGGDEFALITQANQCPIDLTSLSAELCEVLRQPLNLGGNDINVSASLGWAAFPSDGKTASCLLQKSDYALYKSKHSDSGHAVLFSQSDESVMTRESEIARQLESADLEDELYLEFQPIFDTKNNLITSLEALLRWESPVLGLVSPLDFIPLAEKTGRISDLTKLVLKKAIGHAVNWPKSIDLHINISAIDLGKTHVISELIETVKRSAYSPESVVFEVTETAAIDTFENTLETFELLKRNGVRLALDDFGTGYSSLSYLALIPVKSLKIDKHFTERLKPASTDEKILKTIIYLCENLEIDCIVEGVETRSQYDQLRSLGASHMQGFYFSKSLKPRDLGAFMLNYAKQHGSRNPWDGLSTTSRVA